MDYQIKHISSKQELEQAFAFFKVIFAGAPVIDNPEYSLAKWMERMQSHGDLMLYATLNNDVIGIVFGRVIGDGMVVGPVAVHKDYRNLGIAKAMMILLEERAGRYGIQSVTLGAVESAEGFYAGLGYTGALLIQSQSHSIEQLLSVNKKYVVERTGVYDGVVNQVYLQLSKPDRELQKEYEAALPGYYIQKRRGQAPALRGVVCLLEVTMQGRTVCVPAKFSPLIYTSLLAHLFLRTRAPAIKILTTSSMKTSASTR